MKIRPMSQNHLEQVASLEVCCFSKPWSREALKEELENPQAVFLVAEENGEVLGYVGMHVVFGEGYMDNLAVFPHARRKGVGRELVETLIVWLKQHDGLFLTLEVRLSNQAAISLYQSLGFEEAGRRPRFYQEPVEDALLMTLTLRNQ